MKSQDLSSFSMMDLFRTEVETHAARLNEGLLGLEGNGNSTEALQSLMRAAHSIKGAARVVGLDPVVKVAHGMEDCFVATQAGKLVLNAEEIDVLLRAVDWLGQVVKVPDTDLKDWFAAHQEELESLIAAISSIQKPGLKATSPVPHTIPSPKAVSASTPAEPPPAAMAAPAADGGPAARTPSSLDGQDRVVRITAENLDRLMGLAGESLVETRWLQPFSNSLLRLKKDQANLAKLLGRLRETFERQNLDEDAEKSLLEAQQKAQDCGQMLASRFAEFEVFARRSSNLSDRLYQEVVASRMRPFADGVVGFPRLVRDLARKLGKRVEFEISGQTTGVDRDILERMEAPLNHLLRNAVDHGIEMPEERAAAGKPPEGRIRLEASHRAGMLSITVADDGRGIDLEQIRQKVVEKKMAGEEMARDLTESELMEFLFLPGFSTARTVTEISGRGVGLNVVHNMVQEVGGMVRASSCRGRWMSFHLQLPLTLSVIRTLLVEIGGEPYAFPLARIDRSLKVPRSRVELIEDRQFFRLEKENVGLIAAQQVLELEECDFVGEDLSVIVISDRINRYGLAVDRFLGERELVVRPLDPRLGKLPDISAAAVMVDGSPVLIVDVEDLVRSIDSLLTGGRLRKLGQAASNKGVRKRKRILVVDDSLTVREVERKLLEASGYEVEVAVNGMDGWNAVRTAPYDLVVTDVDMPRMNGIELVTAIKAEASLRNLPVMIVSYKDREEDRLRGLAAGANFYLTKSSFHDETLLRAVVDLIGEANA